LANTPPQGGITPQHFLTTIFASKPHANAHLKEGKSRPTTNQLATLLRYADASLLLRLAIFGVTPISPFPFDSSAPLPFPLFAPFAKSLAFVHANWISARSASDTARDVRSPRATRLT
jgi:hypothetical protein